MSTLQPGDTPVNNRIYIMYHGTSVRIARLIIAHGFRRSTNGSLGRGVYLSRDPETASRYPLGLDPSKRVVLKVKVNVGLVIRIDHENHPWRYAWHEYCFHTAWVPPNCADMNYVQEDCVFDPERVEVIGVVSAPMRELHTVERAPPEVLSGLNQTRAQIEGQKKAFPVVFALKIVLVVFAFIIIVMLLASLEQR